MADGGNCNVDTCSTYGGINTIRAICVATPFATSAFASLKYHSYSSVCY